MVARVFAHVFAGALGTARVELVGVWFLCCVSFGAWIGLWHCVRRCGLHVVYGAPLCGIRKCVIVVDTVSVRARRFCRSTVNDVLLAVLLVSVCPQPKMFYLRTFLVFE